LDVLWLGGNDTKLKVSNEVTHKFLDPFPFKKLFLFNVEFAFAHSEKFLKHLKNVEMLLLHECEIELRSINAFD